MGQGPARNERLADIGQRLRQARIAAGYRSAASFVAAVAQDCPGITEGQLRYWERGQRAIDLTVLPVLAQRLGVTTDWLLTGTGPGAAQEEHPKTMASPSGAGAQAEEAGGTTMLKEGAELTALLAQLARGRLDPATLATALLTSTLLRDQREAADARAREADARTRELRERTLAQVLGSPRPSDGDGGESAAAMDGPYTEARLAP